MQLPQIRMRSQFAQIQIDQRPAHQEIRQRPADLQIQQPQADVRIRTTPAKLSIDQTQAWEDMNLMSITRRNDRFAAEGMQAARSGMGRVAREGRQLMEIENGGNPLASQAANRFGRPPKTLAIDFIPSHFAVKIDYIPSEVHIDATPRKPIINATRNEPTFTYHPGHVETSLRQRNELEIWFTEGTTASPL